MPMLQLAMGKRQHAMDGREQAVAGQKAQRIANIDNSMVLLGRHVQPFVLHGRENLQSPLPAQEEGEGADVRVFVVSNALDCLFLRLTGVAEQGHCAGRGLGFVMEGLQRRGDLVAQGLGETFEERHHQTVGASNERLEEWEILLQGRGKILAARLAFREGDLQATSSVNSFVLYACHKPDLQALIVVEMLVSRTSGSAAGLVAAI